MAEDLAIQIIEALPSSLRRITEGVSDEAFRLRPSEGEWSMVEITGHLIDHVAALAERCRRIALEESPLLPAFDQVAYVRDRRYQQQDPAELLLRVSALSIAVAGELRSLPESAWRRTGIHSERGVLTLAAAARQFALGLPEHVLQLLATRDIALEANRHARRPATER